MPSQMLCYIKEVKHKEENTLNSIYTAFKDRRNEPMIIEVRMAMGEEKGVGIDWERACGRFLGAGKFLNFDLDGRQMGA